MENEEKSGITRIRVKNFRSIADSSLDLGAATVLVGPNGSGKSNFLDAVAFLSDAPPNQLGYGVLRAAGVRGGPYAGRRAGRRGDGRSL